MAVVLLKVALTVLSSLLGALALRTRLMELPERRFLSGVLALQLIPAAVAFFVLYVIGHLEPTSDVPPYYTPAGRAILAGQIPYRDFSLSYAPMFSYVGAAVLAVWNSGKAFALFAIVLNAVALVWWYWAARKYFETSAVRACTVLYATSGHILIQALLGTNQTWINAGLAASAWLIATNRSAGSGLAQSIAACATKFLAHLFWPVLWICAQRRRAWLLAAVLPTIAVYGAFVVAGAGAGLLYPLRFEGENISSGNLPYLLDLIFGSAGAYERYIYDGLALVALGSTTLWLYIKARTMSPAERGRLLLAGLALTGLVFMLFSKKSFTSYVTFVMYPVVLMLVLGLANWRARVGFLLVFNALLVAEPSLWFYLTEKGLPLRVWLRTGNTVAALSFGALDVALLGCYSYLARLSVRAVRRSVAGASGAESSSPSTTAGALI